MTLNTHLLRRRHHVSRLALAALLALDACSGKTSSGETPARTSGATGADTPVTIVREAVLTNPQKHIDLIRKGIAQCQDARAIMGISGNDDAEITDEQILQLHAARIEERFSGDRYVEDKRYNGIDYGNWAPEKSCIPKAIHLRTLTIKPHRCKHILIGYDLDKGTGHIEEVNVCAPPKRTVEPKGEMMQLNAAGQTCRWDKQKGSVSDALKRLPSSMLKGISPDALKGLPEIRYCLLEPMHSNGYGIKMVVQTEVEQPTLPPEQQSLPASKPDLLIEKFVSLDVGSPIPSRFFEVPADSANFPRKVIGQ
ncbi:MAG: hypothetical protein LBV61_02090 [Burkholderiaceae bacterium]|jgi:hypothetical protein|nr:hypothetical protein [Burkholderiaceae bacterium]